MAKFNFNLRNPKSDKPTPINLIVRWKNKRLVYSTGETIHPKKWNPDKQRAKGAGSLELNHSLDSITKDASNIFRQFVNDNEHRQPTPKELKECLDNTFNPTQEQKPDSLFGFIEDFIRRNQDSKKELTIKQYKNCYRHLKEYSGKLDFEDITQDFYNNFTTYLLKDKELAENTVGKIIKILKTFLHDATDREVNKNLAFQSRKFKKIDKPTEKIYLTDNELDLMYKLDLTENKRLDKARDLFLIGCYTALRFSDFSQIEPENIVKDNTQLRIRTVKTDEVVFIPLHYRVKEIIKKYDNSAPPSISNQKLNEYIKEVGKLAEINESVIKTEKKGNLRVDKKYKKYELITTHTARRSGATNMFLSGMQPISIMKLTGHKTESAFMRYIRIDSEKNADEMQKHSFFNPDLKVAN